MNLRKPSHIIWLPVFLSYAAYAQSPGGVNTNLSLWVKAESAFPAAGGTLTKWTEQTAANTFTLSGSNMSTVTNVVNFHPVVRFTGSGKLIGNRSITWSECTAVASFTGATTIERGTVISPTTNGTQVNDDSRYFFRSGLESNPGNFLFAGMGTDSIGFEYISSPPSTQVNVLTASGVGNVFNRDGLDARVGSLFGGFTARATTMTGIPQIGDRSTNDSKMIGDIAEIIVYSANNAAGRNKVESYLALKYGLTLGNPATPINYTSSGNTVFWNGTSSYQHNIFGIGTDNGSGLTQTSSNSMNSGSGNGAGQSGLGNLVLTTASALANQHFLMIGTDSLPLSEETITAAIGPSVAIASSRLLRTWRVQNTGSVGSVNLSFDKTGLTLSGGSTVANYYLLIDNDGDGNFNTGAQTFIPATSISGQLVNFSAVTLNNNIVFTLITFPKSMLPLAIDWESFTAATVQNTAILQWNVTDNAPVAYFEVQRSTDGISFTGIGRVDAGNAPYQFEDPLSPGTYFYRIRLVDQQGETTFSSIRSVRLNTAQTLLQLLSNPVQGSQLQLQIALPAPAAAGIRIVNAQGSLLLQQTSSLQTGGNQVTIALPAMTAGIYFVQLQTAGWQAALPFVKL